MERHKGYRPSELRGLPSQKRKILFEVTPLPLAELLPHLNSSLLYRHSVATLCGEATLKVVCVGDLSRGIRFAHPSAIDKETAHAVFTVSDREWIGYKITSRGTMRGW